MANPQKVDKAQPMRECEQALVDTVNELVDWTDNPPVEETVNTVAPPLNATLPAKCEKDTSVAVAGNSQSTMENSVAVGWGSLAGNANTVALGSLAGATGNAGTAVGKGADASGVNSVALGAGAASATTGSLALGYNAHVYANGAIAIGQNSTAYDANAVSFGTTKSSRRLTNVSAPALGTDAANKNYVDSAVALLGRITVYTLQLTCPAAGVAETSVARVNPLSGTPAVLLGVCGNRPSSGGYFASTTAGYYVNKDGKTIGIKVYNAQSEEIAPEVSVMIIEQEG